jgi:HEAT repeat protein
MVRLLFDFYPEVRASAAGALRCLFDEHGVIQGAIREARGIAALVIMLSDKDTEVREGVAKTLRSLCNGVAINRDAIRRAALV